MTEANQSHSDTLELLERFTDAFNNRNPSGMDECLHFPHIMMAGATEIIWDEPDSLPLGYFEQLERESGWHHSEYQSKKLVLSHESQRHYLLDYTRNMSDGSVISAHQNLWVLTKVDGVWGVKIRCY